MALFFVVLTIVKIENVELLPTKSNTLVFF